jgi:hypothetical protein
VNKEERVVEYQEGIRPSSRHSAQRPVKLLDRALNLESLEAHMEDAGCLLQ